MQEQQARDELSGSERITVTMPASTAAHLRAAVAAGGSGSISAFVAEAASDRLDRAVALARWRELTGGPPDAEARAWAERALGVATDPSPGSSPGYEVGDGGGSGGSGVPDAGAGGVNLSGGSGGGGMIRLPEAPASGVLDPGGGLDPGTGVDGSAGRPDL